MLEALQGKKVGGFSVKIVYYPRGISGQKRFELKLVDSDGVASTPVFSGACSQGTPALHTRAWVEFEFSESVSFKSSRLEVNDSLAGELFSLLGSAVPPGGSLMAAYDSFGEKGARMLLTARLLSSGAPAPATPLGFLLLKAGCLAFKDWYFPEGGMEGAQKLQGFKPLNDEVRGKRRRERLKELNSFLSKRDADAQALKLAEASLALLGE